MNSGLFDRKSDDLARRVQWLLVMRLAVAVVGIALVLTAEVGGAGGAAARAPYAVLVAACVLDVGYLFAARRVKDQAAFAIAQIVVDVALVTALVYLTGGVHGFAAILYFAPIFAASLCVSGRAGIVAASASTVLLAGLQTLYHLAAAYGWELPVVDPGIVAATQLRVGRDAAFLIAQGLAFHVVGTLAAWLDQELRRVRILSNEILEKMAEGLVAIDAAGGIVFVNSEARRLLQYNSVKNLVGRDFRDVFRRKEDRAVLDCLLSQLPVTCEIQVHTRERGEQSVEVKTSLLKDEHGVVRGTIGIFTDLTLKKQAEAAEKRAERLEGIEQLAMGIAHEVRNPLASIRGCVQELARVQYMSEDERALANIVVRESDRLDSIIAEFLRFARLKPPALGDCDLVEILQEVAVLLSRRVTDGAVKIDLSLPGAARVRADAPLLTQVFLNLGINAIEACGELSPGAAPAPGAVAGTLRIACREARCPFRDDEDASGRVMLEDVPGFEVTFHDTGRGVSPADLPRLFTPFFTTKTEGTGLGLPIAERIVKSHRGTIALTSEAGRGTTARVLLPAEPRVGDSGRLRAPA